MGLLDAYADSTENVLNVMAARPVEPEPPKPKHSAWSAVPRGVAAAAVEVGGNVIDAGTAIGQLAAAATNENARKMLDEEGFDLRSEESQVQYNYARDLRPDPITAGTAENLVFGLSRGLTKAIPAALTLGPYGGALAFGASEGLTDADNLAAQGVDKATRTKVGMVSAGVNAVGVALPVAGKTLATTAVLVAVGGPLSFMTQQQATRSILEAADYHDIAKQYDPLDPVGLTVATLVPAGFAAAARAGARGAAKPLETGTKAPETAPETVPQTPDIVPTRDDIDAAMVHNLTTLRDVHEAVSAEIAARQADPALQSVEAFAADSLSKAREAINKERLDMQTIAEGRLTDHQKALPVSQRMTADDARARLAELDQMEADAAVKYAPDNPVVAAAFDMHSKRQAMDAQPKPVEDVTPEIYRARVEQLATEQPDLIARLDEAGQPVRLADELNAVRKAAQEGTETEFGALDAPLLKVAAECALATGTAAL